MQSFRTALCLTTLVTIATLTGPALGDSPQAQQQFERAYFLEEHDSNPKAAAELYGAVAADRRAPKALAADARRRQASCLEDVRSTDLAALMPAETMAFLEIRQPGQHLHNLADMLGLIGDPLSNLTPAKAASAVPIPDTPGLAVPAEVFLSPTLLDELSRFRGVALALTGFGPAAADMPELGGVQGLVILHPGEANGLRGLIETAAQFVTPTEPIGNFATIRIEPGITVTFTHRLVIAGTSRELVAGTVQRLTSGDGASLADRPDMQELAGQRDRALVFAFVDAKGALATAYKHLGEDRDAMQAIGIAQGLMDVGHWKSLCASIGSTDTGLHADFTLALEDGHANLVYNLIRTPPMSGKSLRAVPAGAAVVVGIGINPASTRQDSDAAPNKADTLRYVTGLDLGRELFANIEEIAAFCLPGQPSDGPPIPDAGLIITAADPAKSQQLWDQLLTIPSLVMGQQLPEPMVKTIAGQPVKVYPMPQGINIHVVQLDHSLLITPTERAAAASIEALRSGKSILTDPGVKTATERISADTSILALAHAGRCAQLAAQFCSPGELDEVRMMGAIFGNTIATVIADESPTRLHIAGNLTGLPQVKDIVKLISQFIAARAECDGNASTAVAQTQ
ncbi:MAG: hypothetical protein IID40_01000 [Planctomycetes bacterium]|nr:hypothetical protein [Planctomycetota bacterium]